MDWLNGFTITILCIILITSVCDALMPEGNLSKYIRLVLGLVVMVTIVSAALGITKIDFDSVFAWEDTPALNKQNAALAYNQQIAQSFQSNLQSNVKQYILQYFGTDAKVSATIRTDEQGNVESIERLEIALETPGMDSFTLRQKLAEMYGLDIRQVTVGGTD